MTDTAKATPRLRLDEHPDVMSARVYGPKHADGGDYAPLLETGDKEFARVVVEAVNSYDRLRRIEKLAGELANKAEDVGNLLRAYVCTPQAWDNEVVTQKGFDLEQQARELQALIEGKTPTVEPCANPDSIGATGGKDSGH